MAGRAQGNRLHQPATNGLVELRPVMLRGPALIPRKTATSLGRGGLREARKQRRHQTTH